ncbi:hypothetical protein ACFWNK_20775 [Streptomyces sp. NPDC058417]|uniref:hypothetical protein n=1 Tax=unclassified Streptomyces TaxID=2593676 RepID=UPI0036479AA9
MTPRDLADRALPALGGWLALTALALPDGSPLRGVAMVVFLVAGPGAAVLRICAPALTVLPAAGPSDRPGHPDPAFEHHSDLLERLMLTVLVSVALVMLVATVFIASHAFSAERVLLTLTLLATAAAFCPRLRASPPRTAGGTAT